MNKKDSFIAATLSIVVATSLAFGASDNNPQRELQEFNNPIAQGEGKCASGKCGSLKKFSEVQVESDPENQLVYARDGKCGLTGEGLEANVQKTQNAKCSSGLCGK